MYTSLIVLLVLISGLWVGALTLLVLNIIQMWVNK